MNDTKTRATLGGLLASLALLFGSNAHAGHAACSAPAVYPAWCHVTADQKYMRVSAGSYNTCLERIDYSLPPGSRNTLVLPTSTSRSPVDQTPLDQPLTENVSAQVDSVLSRMVAFRNDLDQRLTQAIWRAAHAQKDFSISYAHGRVTGPISFSLRGQPDSNGDLAISIGLSIDVMAKGRIRGINDFFVRGTATATGSNLVFSATYNVNSGSVSGLALTGGSLRTHVDVTLLSSFKKRIHLDVESAIRSHLNANSFTIFGLHSDMPTDTFVHNGTDYGQKIKRQLTNFVENIDVTITQGGKSLSDVYLNVSVGDAHLTTGRIKRLSIQRGPRLPGAEICTPYGDWAQ